MEAIYGLQAEPLPKRPVARLSFVFVCHFSLISLHNFFFLSSLFLAVWIPTHAN